jgi:hypothetical protein
MYRSPKPSLTIYPSWKQKYQKWIIHRKTRVQHGFRTTWTILCLLWPLPTPLDEICFWIFLKMLKVCSRPKFALAAACATANPGFTSTPGSGILETPCLKNIAQNSYSLPVLLVEFPRILIREETHWCYIEPSPSSIPPTRYSCILVPGTWVRRKFRSTKFSMRTKNSKFSIL